MRNSRSILLLLLGIAILGFLNVAVRLRDDGQRLDRRRTLIDDSSAVCRLKIERRSSPAVTIRRDEEGVWRIVDPFSGRADKPAVDRLLDVLSQMAVIDVVSEGELVRLGRTRADFSLSEPFVRVSLETKEQEKTVLSFGMQTPSADGVYVSVEGVASVFVAPPEVLSAVDRPTDAFRRRALFSVAPESVLSFSLRQGTASNLSFVRGKDGWTVDGELASAPRIERFLTELLSSEALDFVWPIGASNETECISASLLAGYGLEPENAVTVTLKGLDDADRQLSLGKAADSGRVYASVQNGTAIVTVRESLRTAALQQRSAFTDSRLFPLQEPSVSFLRLVDGKDAYVLARASDGSWRIETPVSAPAEQTIVLRFLSRILKLPTSAVVESASGFSVALSAEAAPVFVRRDLVTGKDRIDDLRAVEMVRIDPKEVRRMVRTTGERGSRPVSVVRRREDGTWSLEATEIGEDRSAVRPKGISRILEALNPLVAERVERLKVAAADLDRYGLGDPFLTVAVDLDREDAVRRNVLVGARTNGGRFATVGSADAVFVISKETVERLSESPIDR